MIEVELIEKLQPAVVSFGDDIRAVLRIVEDPNIDEGHRAMLAGGIIQVVSETPVLPGVRGVLQRAGNVMVLAIALRRVFHSDPELFEPHLDSDVVLFAAMDSIVELAKAYLGDSFVLLEQCVDAFSSLQFQGHTATQCVRDTESATWLYDSVHEAFIDDEADGIQIARELRLLERIVKPLDERLRRQVG